MEFLTEDAVIRCEHLLGTVGIVPGQPWVRVAGRRLLTAPDPEGRPITGCPNIGAAIKPCTATLRVDAGYSVLLRIDGRAVCLSTVTGFTDGTPPGVVRYRVAVPGQAQIGASE